MPKYKVNTNIRIPVTVVLNTSTPDLEFGEDVIDQALEDFQVFYDRKLSGVVTYDDDDCEYHYSIDAKDPKIEYNKPEITED